MYAVNNKKSEKVFLFGYIIIIFSAHFEKSISGEKGSSVDMSKNQ